MKICAFEPTTGDFVTEEDAKNMRLPFDVGWDRWCIIHNGVPIFMSTDFNMVRRTHSALTTLTVWENLAAAA